MDTEQLKKLIDKAIKAGLVWPKPAPWIAGTEIEQQYFMSSVSTDESVKNEIIAFLNSEPSLEIFNNKMFNQGTSASRVTHETLLQWLLYTASKKSIEEAVSDLDWYLKLGFTPAIEILAISGIDVKERMPLTSSLTLIPFSEVPPSFAREALDPVLLRPENLIRFAPFVNVSGRGQIETRKFLEEADDLCVRSINKIIESGKFPNWDEIILGP